MRNTLRDSIEQSRQLAAELAQPKARTTDPDTSHAADKANRPRRSTQKQLILMSLQAGPSTCEEICRYINRRWNSVSTRLSELLSDGLVEDTLVRRNGQRVVQVTPSCRPPNE